MDIQARAPQSPRFRLPSTPVRRLGLLAALSVPAIMVVQDTLTDHFGLAALLNYVPQQGFGLLPLLGLLLALRQSDRVGVGANLVALLSFFWFLLGWVPGLGMHALPTNSSRHVRLMNYNTKMGEAGGAAIAATLKAQNPDIICLQETVNTNGDPRRSPVEVIHAALPGWECVRAAEVTTLTRFPVISQQRWIMPKPGNRITLVTRLQTPGGPLTVVNTHISTSPTESRRDAQAPWSDRMVRLVEHTGATCAVRRSQLPVLDTALDHCAAPWVMAGDFNNPPRGPFYQHLAARATDAFRVAGRGFGWSFPSGFPLMRIDYCWLGPGVGAYRSFVPRADTSDHLPLVTDLELPAK